METPIVGKQLRLFRESRNMKQQDFCEYTGIKQQTVSGIETGRSEPSTALLQMLFLKFPDLNPDWLLLGTGPMLRDGRALVPAAGADTPTPTPDPPAPTRARFTSGSATVEEADTLVELARAEEANKQLRERLEDARQEITWLRGKSTPSLYTADPMQLTAREYRMRPSACESSATGGKLVVLYGEQRVCDREAA